MGAEAKLYLQEHSIPQLFEGLMTGLIYNRPANPLEFLEEAIAKIKANPEEGLSWDMFIDKGLSTAEKWDTTTKKAKRDSHELVNNKENKGSTKTKKVKNKQKDAVIDKGSPPPGSQTDTGEEGKMVLHRSPSVIKAADVAQIPHVPVVLFMGGPGGGKTRHAARVSNALADQGLVHICMPDVIRNALAKYKDHYSEWKSANDHYLRGELIPNHLALALVKAEMGRHPDAAAFFLEGFPREARQVEDFERQVKSVNMALILDYDEKTLRDHMEKRGMGMEIIDQRIKEFKQKTLPSAKYFDDQRLLHLIPGEKDDQTIFERMRDLVKKAMETGVPVLNSNPPSQAQHRSPEPLVVSPPPTEINGVARVRTASSHHSDDSNNVADISPAETSAPASRTTSRPASGAELPPTTVSSRRPPTVKESRSQSRGRNSKQSSASSAVRSASIKSKRSSISSIKENPEKPSSSGSEQSTPAVTVNEENIENVDPSSSNPTVVLAPPTAPPTAGTAASEEIQKVAVADDKVPQGLPNNAPVVLIIGAPGAQKSEIAKRIAQKYDGFVLLSMGELLRAKVESKKDDELWQRIKKKIDQGETVPMKLCRELLYNELHDIGKSSWGYVIEGYPRTQTQLEDMESVLGKIDMAILIDCTEQFCMSNIEKRYQEFKNERPDDDPEVVKFRLSLFKQNTLPMLKYLDDNGLLRVVDGDSDPDTVFKDVVTAIDHRLFIEEDESGNSLGDSKKGSLNE